MSDFRHFIEILCQVLAFIIFIRAVLSWFAVSRSNPIVAFFEYSTEPILAPLRRVVPRIGMIDITPMVAIIILLVIASVI
jgi:YggT family protein